MLDGSHTMPAAHVHAHTAASSSHNGGHYRCNDLPSLVRAPAAPTSTRPRPRPSPLSFTARALLSARIRRLETHLPYCPRIVRANQRDEPLPVTYRGDTSSERSVTIEFAVERIETRHTSNSYDATSPCYRSDVLVTVPRTKELRK